MVTDFIVNMLIVRVYDGSVTHRMRKTNRVYATFEFEFKEVRKQMGSKCRCLLIDMYI